MEVFPSWVEAISIMRIVLIRSIKDLQRLGGVEDDPSLVETISTTKIMPELFVEGLLVTPIMISS